MWETFDFFFPDKAFFNFFFFQKDLNDCQINSCLSIVDLSVLSRSAKELKITILQILQMSNLSQKNISCISFLFFFFQAIQGTTIVVIHPGSSNLHIGRATDHFAQSIPHAIATRIGERILKKEQKQNLFYRKGISVRLAFLWFCGAEFGN